MTDKTEVARIVANLEAMRDAELAKAPHGTLRIFLWFLAGPLRFYETYGRLMAFHEASLAVRRHLQENRDDG